MNISENIKQIRESKRLSQAEVSRRLNLDPPSYFRFEKRGSKLSLEQIENIANALEVSVREVLGFGVETTDKSEIEILENENKILREKSEMLDNIESTFLSIFQDHYKQVSQSIDNGEYSETILHYEKLTDDEKFNLVSFIIFCQETEWYEVSMKLSIIKEQKIRYAWDRYEYINPFSLKIDDIPKFKASNPDKLNLSDDEIIIDIVKERGGNKRYRYLDSEVETMLEMYNKISSGKMIIKSKNLSTQQSYIGESTKVKIENNNHIIEKSDHVIERKEKMRKPITDNPRKTMEDRLEELERKIERLGFQKMINKEKKKAQ
jgi:transcriptional regulator with XRE-family HTH domain